MKIIKTEKMFEIWNKAKAFFATIYAKKKETIKTPKGFKEIKSKIKAEIIKKERDESFFKKKTKRKTAIK